VRSVRSEVAGERLIIGVLDLQGDVREHLAALAELGVGGRLVKQPSDLEGVHGLILPGGESTTLSMLLESTGLFDEISARLASSEVPVPVPVPVPVLGTCAGLILLARELLDGRSDQRSFGVLDAVVRRNGYGRQAQSFEADLVFGSGEAPRLPAVFIRAPRVVSVGPSVEVLASLDDSPVLVRQGTVLASSFHPELTPDRRVHSMFADLCRSVAEGGGADLVGESGDQVVAAAGRSAGGSVGGLAGGPAGR
jgi:pyridoxal 5'-phosphate synthase pdxT subunit